MRMQAVEQLAAGPAYERSGHVVADHLGRRYQPDTVSDYWAAACAKAGVKRIRLHDARHTCGTLMHLEHNVPVAIISAWLGHADTAFTMRTYVHNQPEKLVLAAESISSWTRVRSPHGRESDRRFRSSCPIRALRAGSRTDFFVPRGLEVPFSAFRRDGKELS
jgi:integrase